MPGWLLISALGLAAAVSTGRADVLELHDGARYEGRVIERDDEVVVFEINIGAVRLARRFNIAQVRSLQVDGAAAGHGAGPPALAAFDASAAGPADVATSTPTYLRIPLHGEFGAAIDGPTLGACLDHARQVGPDVVVLDIDSPGGALETLVDVAERLGRFSRDTSIPLIAFVNNDALSAAALTTMSVPTIYVTPDASLGAALVINVGPGGAVSSVAAGGDVAEKFLSVFRARVRGWVQQAGHDPLLSEAMIDPSVELALVHGPDGEPRVLRGPIEARDLPPGDLPESIVASGRLLTLTALEAQRVGLADGVVANLDELGQALGCPDWRPIDDEAARLMAERADLVARVQADYERSARGLLTTFGQLTDGSAAQLGDFERGITGLRSRITRIERLVEEHPFLTPRAMADFPNGLGGLRRQCDEVLADIRQKRREYIRSRQ